MNTILLILSIIDIALTIWLLIIVATNYFVKKEKEFCNDINCNSCNGNNTLNNQKLYFITKKQRYKKIIKYEDVIISRYLSQCLSLISIDEEDLLIFLNLSEESKQKLKIEGYEFIKDSKKYYLRFDYIKDAKSK